MNVTFERVRMAIFNRALAHGVVMNQTITAQLVRDAIAAMREPSKEMLDAVGYDPFAWAERNWQAMIDVLLDEAPKS